jgi:ribosome-associated protein
MGGRTNKQRREDRGRHNNGNEMLEFIDTPVTSKEMVGDIDSIAAAPEDDDLADLVRCIVRAADGRKADNIVAMRVSKVSTVTSFVVIATGNSRPQNQAITAVVKDEVEEAFGFLPGGNGVPEGSADSGWTVLDYGSVMVHVMTPKSRLFYNVEGKWQDEGGEYMDISDAILPNVNFVKLEDGGSDSGDGDGEDTTGSTMEGVAEEDDPFWS